VVTLKELQKTYSLEKLRTDKCKTPWDELQHLSSELRELTEAFLDDGGVEEELADIVIVAVMLANRFGIDIERAVMKKTELNRVMGRLL